MMLLKAITLWTLASAISAASLGKDSESDRITLDRQDCQQVTTQVKSDGFAIYTLITKTCRGLTPSSYQSGTCEERCHDPVKRRYLSKKLYKTEPVTYYQKFVTREGVKFEEKLTLSCRCVSKRGEKKSSKSRRRRVGSSRRRHLKRRQ